MDQKLYARVYKYLDEHPYHALFPGLVEPSMARWRHVGPRRYLAALGHDHAWISGRHTRKMPGVQKRLRDSFSRASLTNETASDYGAEQIACCTIFGDRYTIAST
jgi:hypothetical protein